MSTEIELSREVEPLYSCKGCECGNTSFLNESKTAYRCCECGRIENVPIELSQEVRSACMALLPFNLRWHESGSTRWDEANQELDKYENLARAIIAQVREEMNDGR